MCQENCAHAEDAPDGIETLDDALDQHFLCEECDKGFPASDKRAAPDDGRELCAECLESLFFACAECLDIMSVDDESDTESPLHSGERYCQTCYDELHAECEHCNDTVNPDGMHDVHNIRRRSIRVCADCRNNHYSHCHDCDEVHHDDNMHSVSNCSCVCDGCYENNYFYCEGCNEECHQDDYGEEGRCQGCCDNDDDGPIIAYGNKETLRAKGKFGKPKDRTYYGIELEMVASGDRGDTAQEVIDLVGDDFCVCKEDGSLPTGGFELVTAPATPDIISEHFGALFDDMPRGLKSWDTGGKCGMHVHVSRKGLTQFQLGKLLVFVNEPINKRFVEEIAGRSNNTYCAIQKKKPTDCRRSFGRYSAINTQNDSTVEFRIFRGTLRRESFFKNLEFVYASVAFVRESGLQELAYFDFVAFVERRKKDYPNLVAFLRSKGYLPPAKTIPTQYQETAVPIPVTITGEV